MPLAQVMAAQEEQRKADEMLAAFPSDYVAAVHATELRRLVVETAKRQIEALRLYEPLPLVLSFHASPVRIRLLRGSNRGGKTLGAAMEVARAVTGKDPHNKYVKENGRCFAVGKDLRHVGEVMWRKLYRAGQFKIIRDCVTGNWRAFRPWNVEDLDRESKSRAAPPLIPSRYIKDISWESKKDNIPGLVKLANGWELSFFSSLGKPPQGSDIDLGWMDEEIVDRDWVPELMARILDRNGRLVWSATPQLGSDQLFDLHERAEAEELDPAAGVREYVVLLKDNPHIEEKVKKEFAKDLSEEDRRVRIGGEFALTSFKVYPEFSMDLHGVKNFPIPANWCKYIVVDPGHQVCAVLFAAVPPKGAKDEIHLYDELYLKECNAAMFADRMAHKTAGQNIQAFLIDSHMALHTELGVGKSVVQQYADALRAKNVRSLSTGSNFHLASDDIGAGLLAVHDMLRIRDDGSTKLRVHEQMLPSFEWEIKRYHKQRIAGQVIDKPNQRRHNHLMDTLRYLAMFNPRWVAPSSKKAQVTGAVKAFRDKKKRRQQENGGGVVRLGPGRQ